MRNNRSIVVTVLCVVCMWFMPLSSAAPVIIIPSLSCEIMLSKESISSGETLHIHFVYTNISDDDVRVSLSDGYDVYGDPSLYQESESLKISIKDKKGNEVTRRELLCRPNSQSTVLSCQLKPGETVTGEYPLHLRISTLLEPGEYSVDINSMNISHGSYLQDKNRDAAKPRITIVQGTRETISVPSLTFTVTPYDEIALKAAYDAFMEKARHALANPTDSWFQGQDFLDIEAPIRTILWAEGPMAVQYQLELIYDFRYGFIFWPPALVNTWDNIVRYATVEQVKQVLEIARHAKAREIEVGRRSFQYYSPTLVWAIYQWHTQGSESIRALTQEIEVQLPEEEPCPHIMRLGTFPYGKP